MSNRPRSERAEIRDLLRSMPARGASDADKAAWWEQKAELFDRFADLIDPAEFGDIGDPDPSDVASHARHTAAYYRRSGWSW